MKVDVRKGYRDQRKQEYPPIEDQLDMIFHDGINAWRAKIADIKKRFPK